MAKQDNRPVRGLGIDAGGTATRWALIDTNQTIIKQGQSCGLTGLLMDSTEGQKLLVDALGQIALQCADVCAKSQLRIYAGFTGLPDDTAPMVDLFAQALGTSAALITLVSDIELIHCAHFEPGEGIIVYAGTGSYASYLDHDQALHRVGARGGILDDGGSGFWIAREALRKIWRAEDEQVGSWKKSSMARAIFDQLGGSEWAYTRQFVYGQANAQMRGRMGVLATAVGASADSDPSAHKILKQAGSELARLGNIMCQQFGSRPIIFAGRVFALHPIILETARAELSASNVHSIELSAVQSVASIAARIALEQTL